MSVSNVSTKHSEEFQTAGAVFGEPAVSKRFSVIVFRPTHVVATYTRVDGGPWSVSVIRISGPRIKVDGTESIVIAGDCYYGLDNAPEWANKFVNEHMPPE